MEQEQSDNDLLKRVLARGSSGTTSSGTAIGTTIAPLTNPWSIGPSSPSLPWSGSPAPVIGPGTGYPPGTVTLPHTAPIAPIHSIKTSPLSAQDKFAEEADDLVNYTPSMTYKMLLDNMAGAIRKVTQKQIGLEFQCHYDSDTREIAVRLLLVNPSSPNVVLLKVSRVLRRESEHIAESLLSEAMELIMMRGILNMVKSELNLTDEPEF